MLIHYRKIALVGKILKSLKISEIKHSSSIFEMNEKTLKVFELLLNIIFEHRNFPQNNLIAFC